MNKQLIEETQAMSKTLVNEGAHCIRYTHVKSLNEKTEGKSKRQ